MIDFKFNLQYINSGCRHRYFFSSENYCFKRKKRKDADDSSFILYSVSYAARLGLTVCYVGLILRQKCKISLIRPECLLECNRSGNRADYDSELNI